MLLEDLLFYLEDLSKKNYKQKINVSLNDSIFSSILEQFKNSNFDIKNQYSEHLIFYFEFCNFRFYRTYNFNILDDQCMIDYYYNTINNSSYVKILTKNERIIKDIIE